MLCPQGAAVLLLSARVPIALAVTFWHAWVGVVDLVVGEGRVCTLWPAMEGRLLGG